jgi:hexosaminidase
MPDFSKSLVVIRPGFLKKLSLAAGIGLTLSLGLPACAEIHLLPQPRELHLSGKVDTPEKLEIRVPGHDAEDEFAATTLTSGILINNEANEKRSYSVTLLRADSSKAHDVLSEEKLTFSPEMKDEGYVLVIHPKEAYIIGSTSAGIFYGVQTLHQLLTASDPQSGLPTGVIRDWPAMKYRGVDDDLSRGPVPTLAFQKHQVEVLASVKLNVYSPYIEHTLAYDKEPMAAPRGGALTRADVEELVKFAQQYHVTVVPEQEAFGHLHHVLKYELYKDDAETPHGFVLAPGQAGTLPLIHDWFTQIAEEFPSPFIHIGADETFDLGLGRTGPAVQKNGLGPTYVQFLAAIDKELAPLHRRLLFWGDIGGSDPKAVAGLPKDMIAIPWVYDPEKSYDQYIKPFADNGIETWVAPGDANWNLVYPDSSISLPNIQGFARDGQRLGSTGLLTTVWNDDGDGLFNEDWYGVLFTSAAGWQPGEASIPAYKAVYGPVFNADFSGKINEAQEELTAANAVFGKAKVDTNSNDLFWMDPWSEEGQVVSTKIRPYNAELREHAERAVVLLAQVRIANPNLKEKAALEAMDLGARRLDLIGMKFQYGDEIQHFYATVYKRQHDMDHSSVLDNSLYAISSNNGRCQDIRDAFSAIKDQYREVWLAENRPYWLGNVLVRFDLEMQRWQQRGNAFTTAIHSFDSNKGLPPASTFGMPAVEAAQ